MKKKVLILTNSDSGLYDFRKELLMELIHQEYEVMVSVPIGAYAEKIRQIGCEVIPAVFERRGMNPVKDLKLFLSYARLIGKKKPDIVLTYTIKPNIYGGLACRFCRVPYLSNITGLGTAIENPGTLRKILLWLYRVALKEASCILFQNAYNKEFMEENGCQGKKSILLSGSGVNLTEHPYCEYPSEENEIRLLSVMRVMKDKGIEELLQSIPLIHNRFPKTVFAIAGSYEEETRAQYEPMINDLQKQGLLRYYGYRDDLGQIMADHHIIVHPSYHEGMSNVLLEAAATGRPVVATNITGCIETYIPGVSGESCKRKDSQSLQQALERILEHTSDERSKMGQAGRSHVETYFDRQQVVKVYLENIHQIIMLSK